MSHKPTTKPPTPKPQATGYSQEAWDKLEQQRIQMQGQRIAQLFQARAELVIEAIENDKQLREAIGNSKETSQKILVLAIENAGSSGLALAKARRFIADPTELKEAREALLSPKDEDGGDLPPKIKEKRGDNNEMRLFLIEEDENKGEEAEVEAEA